LYNYGSDLAGRPGGKLHLPARDWRWLPERSDRFGAQQGRIDSVLVIARAKALPRAPEKGLPIFAIEAPEGQSNSSPINCPLRG
jgi:hypothetical protein